MPLTVKTSVFSAAVAVLAATGGPLSAHLGLLPPYTGFRLFALGTFAGSAAAVGFGLVSLARSWSQPDAPGRGWAWLGLLAGAGLLLLMAFAGASAAKVPPIHDVTTDPQNPPRFALSGAAPRLPRDHAYPHGDPRTAERQREAYADLEPIRLQRPPDEAFAAALATARDLGWEIAREDPGQGRIEATETSRLFRFVDDVAIRVRSGGDGGGSVVDLRSVSRVGISDLGANARRIRRFRDALQDR